VALAEEMEHDTAERPMKTGQTDADMISALENEIERCKQRMNQIDLELRNLHNRASVELSLEIKLAYRQGRDLLAEMVVELENKIGRKTAERDMIKAQFDSLDRGQQIVHRE
jgi:predicted  nucleic acid-binding Zn-ribbon protein